MDFTDLYHLVDRELAQINGQDESLVYIEADHYEVIAIEPDSELCKHLLSFFNKIHDQRQILGSQALARGENLSI